MKAKRETITAKIPLKMINLIKEASEDLEIPYISFDGSNGASYVFYNAEKLSMTDNNGKEQSRYFIIIDRTAMTENNHVPELILTDNFKAIQKYEEILMEVAK